MAAPHAKERRSSFQPFQCNVCQSRFTRHENLKRHAALHSRTHGEASLACDYCQATFSRPDLRHRHVKRKHPEHQGRRAAKGQQCQRASDGGQRQRERVLSVSPAKSPRSLLLQYSGDECEVEDGSRAWHTAMWHDQQPLDYNYHDLLSETAITAPTTAEGDARPIATDTLAQPRSTSESACLDPMVTGAMALEQGLLLDASFLKLPLQFDSQIHPVTISRSTLCDASLDSLEFQHDTPGSLSSNGSPQQFQNEWYPSESQTARGCELFFTHISHFVPFLHRPTFDAAQAPPYLVLSMLCLAYQYDEDPDCGDQPGSGESFSRRCFHRARGLVTSEEEMAADETTDDITLIQAYLLLQICAMMYLCGKDSAYALKMHAKMISLARARGLMQPLPNESASTEDLDSLWCEFLRGESNKRTLFAVHQIDALWYQFLSIPRCISHLEVKHDLPCPENLWMASSAAEWAHRQLLARHSNTPVQYAEAIRRFLSSDTNLKPLPAFSPYGAINIAQFLISSARETTGWSTMTGMLSSERICPLRSSLVALSPFIHPHPEVANITYAALCEATWETAMIELQMWSPSHTGGIVGGSMDAWLDQSSSLTPSCSFLSEPNTAKAIQPHLDWFLRYLDTTLTPSSEAPWVALYAFRAFLIAWKLVRGGTAGAMECVAVHDGDVKGALAWARKVFRRRERWQLGKLILASLDTLEA